MQKSLILSVTILIYHINFYDCAIQSDAVTLINMLLLNSVSKHDVDARNARFVHISNIITILATSESTL